MKMKKNIQSMMAFAAIVSFASCSSEDNNTIENDNAAKVMIFTATQESNETSTKATLNGTSIYWESGDQLTLLYGSDKTVLLLTDGVGSKSGKFSGETKLSDSYIAVYPNQANASLSGNDVINVTLPAIQEARDNSFNKSAALMMAKSNSTSLEFKNAVGYVKVIPMFACSQIVLQAADENEYLAGKCTLSYDTNTKIPSVTFTSDQTNSIKLTGDINANTAYYIAVPATTLSAGWSISFTATDGNVFTRTATKPIKIERNTIINLGTFEKSGDYFELELTRNGNVDPENQVDMGVFTIGDNKYRVIFTKSNLKRIGLAANEYAYGDYFAWGATDTWYKSIDNNGNPIWKEDKSNGYASVYCDSYENDNTYVDNGELKTEYDAAYVILHGNWRIPSTEIWQALNDNAKYEWKWETEGESNGIRIRCLSNDKNIFLPAAGHFENTNYTAPGSRGLYWSNQTGDNTYGYCLDIKSNYKNPKGGAFRYYGFPIRPVRLVSAD